MLRAIAVLHFPIYALKSCPAPAAFAAGAGHYFSLTAYNLTFKTPFFYATELTKSFFLSILVKARHLKLLETLKIVLKKKKHGSIFREKDKIENENKF